MQHAEHETLVSRLLKPLRTLTTTFKVWSEGQATQTQVSDCYVTLCQEYNAVKAVFQQSGMQVNDFVDVPGRLRQVLEEALSYQKSPTVYKKYEPQIRAVMAELFTQLKDRKGVRAISQHYRDRSRSSSAISDPYYPNSPSTRSNRNSMQTLGPPIQAPPPMSPTSSMQPPNVANNLGIRTKSSSHSLAGSTRMRSYSNESQMSTPKGPISGPVSGPFHGTPDGGTQSHMASSMANSGSSNGKFGNVNHSFNPSSAVPGIMSPGSLGHPGPVSPRFSQPAPSSPSLLGPNHLGHTPSKSVAVTSPIYPSSRALPNPLVSPVQRPSSVMSSYKSPVYSPKVRNSHVEPENDPLAQLQKQKALDRQASRRYSIRQASKAANNTPEVGYVPTTMLHRRSNVPDFQDSSVISSRRALSQQSTPSSSVPRNDLPPNDIVPETPAQNERRHSYVSLIRSPRVEKGHIPETLHVFLKYGTMIRKASLARPASVAAIRLKFLEVCSYIHSENDTFPPIELMDNATGIQYELTEATVSDVSEGSLLTLKVETDDERSVQQEIGQLKEMMQQLVLKIDTKPEPPVVTPTPEPATSQSQPGSDSDSDSQVKPKPEVKSEQVAVINDEGKQDLERELAVLRQFCSKTVTALREEAQTLRADLNALNTAVPMGDRSFIQDARTVVDADTKELLSRMDELSDIVDFQRISVGSNGVRYPQHELDKVRRELNLWTNKFSTSERFLHNERPLWKKIWQTELSNVIQEQEWLKQTEDLYTALHSDLNQTLRIFDLVCSANAADRPAGPRGPLVKTPVKPGEEKDISNAVFREIEGLNLDSERREEAIKRAERLHKARLALRSEEFVDELNSFVTDAKLKPNGGHEEVERKRLEREERTKRLAEESELEAMKYSEELKQQKKAERAAARAAMRESKMEVNDQDADI